MGKKKLGKIPKRIGGVKLSKDVRKQAGAAIAALESPIVRDLAVAALGMAAGAIVRQAEGMRAGPGDDARSPRVTASTAQGGSSSGVMFAEMAAGLAAAALARWAARGNVTESSESGKASTSEGPPQVPRSTQAH